MEEYVCRETWSSFSLVSHVVSADKDGGFLVMLVQRAAVASDRILK